MGLHLCYELAFDPTADEAAVTAVLGRLRDAARRSSFRRVSPLLRRCEPETPPGPPGHGDALEWLFGISSDGHRATHGKRRVSRSIAADLAIGFVVAPGARCEPAAFGLARYPEPVDARRGEVEYTTTGWHWHAVCKTQYASVVSDEHLVACHTGLVALLDCAAALGIDVTVRDETHFWETRDPARLVQEVRDMNRIVARMAGALSDRMPGDLRVAGAILDHPRFERLEMGD
jgi:hypothetical protein